MRLADVRAAGSFTAGMVPILLYFIDKHAPLSTGSFIRPDGSIESTVYAEEFVPLRGRLPTHGDLDRNMQEVIDSL